MKKTLKRICILMIIVMLLFSIAIPCFAETEKGKITITLMDTDKNRIDDATVYICQVVRLNNTGYNPTTAFENSGISISEIMNNPDETSAKTIVEYIKKNNLDTLSGKIENGKATFSDLDLGVWVVFPKENDKYIFNPYLVFLPFESNGKLYYEVSSIPKTDESNPDEINIYVVKKWEDKNNASKKRPNSITVELLNGELVVSSTELSEENGWSHTFAKVSKNGNYSVKEKTVSNYKADYSGDATNGFVITNTYIGDKLPQTGQHWLPIVFITVAGVCFVLLGFYEIGAKKNGKKK